MNQQVIYYPREAVSRAAEQFETPFFLYEESRLRENCRNFRESFRKFFPDFWPLYAVKANNNPEVLKIIFEEGFGVDCSSESEAWMCKKLGATGMYTGNYTPAAELKYAQECGMIINLDDISMVDFLDELGNPEMISFRINPGIGAGTAVLAGPDAKYGVPFEEAPKAYAEAQQKGVKKFGIHMMTGSNVLDQNYFASVVEKLFEIMATVKRETGIEIEFMNIGGGFGVPYRPEQESLDMEKIAGDLRAVVDKQCALHGLKEPRLMAEPGRFIAADMGFLIGKVEVIKNGYKKFVGIDASSNDMPRPSIYEAYHHVSVLNAEDRPREIVSVVGKICENCDQFAKDRDLPFCKIGDMIVIHNCGGHAYAMGHNYNGRLRHAEYLLGTDGSFKMIRRAETFEDLYSTTNL